MNLTLPVVSQTPGPTWASEINDDLSIIDAHNHAGSGALVPVAGLDINADLSLDTHALTNVTKVALLDQGSNSTVNSVYAVSGNLWWKNGSGTAVQITSGGSVNVGGAGSIGGITGSAAVNYDSPTLSFEFIDQSGNPASLVGNVFVGSSVTLGTASITASGAGTYAINLPTALPVSSTSFLTCTTGGQLGYTSQANGITRQMQAAVGQTIGVYQSDGPFNTSSNVLLPIVITTTGRPVCVGLQGPVAIPSFVTLNGTAAGYYTVDIGINITSGAPIAGFTPGVYAYGAIAGYVSNTGNSIRVPVSSINAIVPLPLGTYTLQPVIVNLTGSGGTPNVTVNGQVFAYEL
jgi:hypothetical protein